MATKKTILGGIKAISFRDMTVEQHARHMYESSRGAPRPLTLKWCREQALRERAEDAKATKLYPKGTKVIVYYGLKSDKLSTPGAGVVVGMGHNLGTVKVRMTKTARLRYGQTAKKGELLNWRMSALAQA